MIWKPCVCYAINSNTQGNNLMQFVPLWDSILDNPKMYKLGPERLGRWIYMLLAAQKHDQCEGTLPDLETLAFWLRLPETTVQEWLEDLARSKLIDWKDKKYSVHDWSHWRCRGDFGAAVRMKRMRERRKNEKDSEDTSVLRNAVTSRVTPPVTSHVPPEKKSKAEASKASALEESPLPLDEKSLAPNPGGALDTRQQQCIDQAIRHWGASNGDVIVGELLRTFSPEIVMESMDMCFEKFKQDLKPAYLRKTCEGKYRDSQNGRTP